MNVQRPRNSNCHSASARWRTSCAGAIYVLKPSPEVLKAIAASSEKEGKKLDGFQLFRGILSKQ
jgi:hypothetical protein